MKSFFQAIISLLYPFIICVYIFIFISVLLILNALLAFNFRVALNTLQLLHRQLQFICQPLSQIYHFLLGFIYANSLVGESTKINGSLNPWNLWSLSLNMHNCRKHITDCLPRPSFCYTYKIMAWHKYWPRKLLDWCW